MSKAFLNCGKLILTILWSLQCISCQHNHELRIAEEIEEPNYSILQTLIPLLKKSTNENIELSLLHNDYSNIDSLKTGAVDLYIADNTGSYNENLSAIAPIFPEILHILHKKDYQPNSIKELLSGKKVYAGTIGSSEYSLCKNIITHFNINDKNIEFLTTKDLFKSDVIMLFTDLVTLAEIRDLDAYEFYSLDDPSLLGTGTIAEAISIRYPGLTPFIIPKSTYADFTPEPVLTLMSESILICRSSMDEHITYEISKVIKENKQLFYNISPLMHLGFRDDFENTSAVYPLHKGAMNYINRDKPSYLQRHSNVFSILLSLFLAVLSGLFTLRNHRKNRKKDSIDVYYQKLDDIRKQIPQTTDKTVIGKWLEEIRALESETINLVINERLNPDASYMVYLNMISSIKMELKQIIDK